MWLPLLYADWFCHILPVFQYAMKTRLLNILFCFIFFVFISSTINVFSKENVLIFMGKSGQGDNFLIGKIHTKFWVKYLNQSLILIFKFPVQLHLSKAGHASQNLLDQNQHWKHQDNWSYKVTGNTPEQRQRHRSSIFTVNFEHSSNIVWCSHC